MRVCHVNLAKGYRGGERQTEILMRQLSSNGIAQVFVGRRGQPLADRARQLPHTGTLEVEGNPYTAWLSVKAVDLVHAHEGRAAHAAYLRHFLSGTPYIITRRVLNPPKPNAFTRRVYRGAARVAAVSGAIGSVLENYDPGLAPVVIPDATSDLVPDPNLVAELRAQYAGKFVVGHVGELDNDHKGQLYLIRAARMLQQSHPDLHFVLVGKGKDEQWLRSEAEGLPNVSFAGFVDDVGAYLELFDLFVFPSLHEGLGSILLDAKDFGLPIIATEVGGIPEVVSGHDGILVPPADTRALVGAIELLYSDEWRRAELSDRSRRSAEQYSSQKMLERYVELYELVLSVQTAG